MGILTTQAFRALNGGLRQKTDGFVPDFNATNPQTVDRLIERDTTTVSKRDPVPYSGVVRGVLAPVGFTSFNEVLTFQFNPEVINDRKATDWQNGPLLGFAHLQYLWMSGGARQLNFELHFEATGDVNSKIFGRDVNYGDANIDTLPANFPNGTMDYVNLLRSYLYPLKKSNELVKFVGNNPSPQDRFTHPPVLIFSYGEYYVECVLSSAEVVHILWDAKLKPVRTKAQVTLDVLEGYSLNVDKRITQ